MKYFSISSKLLIEEAEKRGFEVEILSKSKNLFYIRGNRKEQLFKLTDFGGNSSLGFKLCDDKELTNKVLESKGLPVARSYYLNKDEFENFHEKQILDFKFPLIVKPIDEGHGNGVIMEIKDFFELKNKLKKSFDTYNDMIIQEQISGDEIRVLVVKGEVVVAINRIPAHVFGNGKNTIKELIEIENDTNILRGNGYEKPLSNIVINDELIGYINKFGYDLNDIPEEGKKVQLVGNSNLGTGGIPINVTDLISDEIKDVSVKTAKYLGLEICGVDILTSDITKSLKETGGIILEANATPGIGGHKELLGINSAKIILDKIFNEK